MMPAKTSTRPSFQYAMLASFAIIMWYPTVARAQASPPDRTLDNADPSHQQRFDAAIKAFSEGHYEEALAGLKEVHAETGRPDVLYMMGTVAGRMRRDGEALEHFERYLRESPNAPNRTQVEARIQILHDQIARDQITHDQVTQRNNETETASEAPEPLQSIPKDDDTTARQSKPRRRSPPTGALIALSVGAAGLVSTAVAGGLALAEDRNLDAEDSCKRNRSCTDDDLSTLRRRRRTTDISLGIGLTGAVVGLTWWLVKRRQRKRDERPSAAVVSPWVTPRQTGISATFAL